MQHGYPHNTKRVLLCGYFGFGNMGDEATLAAALKAFREYRLKVRVMFNPCGDFEPFSRLGAQYCNRYSPSELRRAISECDALLLTGGSLLQNETSKRSLLYYTAITALAEREGKPIYMLSSGFGEVSGRLGNAFANRALARLSFAGMRTGDDIMAVKDRVRCPIVNMPDLVLLEKLHREKKRDYFAVIPKGRSTALIREARRLRAEGLFPVVIPLFTGEDSEGAYAAAQSLGCEIFVSQSHDEILARLSTCRVTLTERLHGAIFSILSSTPIEVAESSQKCRRFASELMKRCEKIDTPPPLLHFSDYSHARFLREETDFSALVSQCADDVLAALDSVFGS